jgi:predicted DNA-binding transcriptional regulator YafY
MIEAIADAIRNKRCITFNYPPGIRYIEPHALGRSAAGDVLLRAYQTAGASKSEEHEHWKLFRLDRCEGQEPNRDTFLGPREGYKQNDKAMKGGIIAQL